MQLESVKGTVIATYWDGYLRLIEAYGFDSLLYTTNKELELAGRKLQIMEDKLGVLTESKSTVEDKSVWKSRFLFLNPQKSYEV